MSDFDRIWDAVRQANGVPPETKSGPTCLDQVRELLESIAAELQCGCGPPICRCRGEERLRYELEDRQYSAREALKLLETKP